MNERWKCAHGLTLNEKCEACEKELALETVRRHGDDVDDARKVLGVTDLTNREASVTVNGTSLTNAESATLRCALSSFLSDLHCDPHALGHDAHGTTMRSSYLQHGRNVERLLIAKDKGSPPPINGDHAASTLTVPPTAAICKVAGVTIFGPEDYVAAARAALEAPPAPTYPDELTPELREVLGWPNFRCGPVAHVFQAAGYPIKKRAEDEQAFVLHWFTKLVLRHGADWWSAAREEIEAIQRQLAEQGTANGGTHD